MANVAEVLIPVVAYGFINISRGKSRGWLLASGLTMLTLVVLLVLSTEAFLFAVLFVASYLLMAKLESGEPWFSDGLVVRREPHPQAAGPATVTSEAIKAAVPLEASVPANLSDPESWLNDRMGFILREGMKYIVQGSVVQPSGSPTVVEKYSYRDLAVAYFHKSNAGDRDQYLWHSLCPRPVGHEHLVPQFYPA